MDIDILILYYNAGLSLLPVKGKVPTIPSWDNRKTELVKPNGEFSDGKANGVGVICGRVSGGLEIIDFDIKNDLTGKLMSEYRKLLDNEELLKKLVIQKTPSGGFHFIYKCEEVEGNKKLARRETTDAERVSDPKTKAVATIETRGEGGYFLIDPSVGYKIIQGSVLQIPVISVDERELLHECAKGFNEYIQNQPNYKQRAFEKKDPDSPFAKFKEDFDTVNFLMQEGWAIVRQFNDRIQLRRPGKKEGISATYFLSSKVLHVFTTSSEFEGDSNYDPVSIYAILKCNNDLSVASQEIRKMGYGKPYVNREILEAKKPILPAIDVVDIDIWKWEGVSEYLESLQNGTFQMGLGTGMKRFNNHFRFKRGNLNVINGHDNVGKTIVLVFLMLITAKYYNWKWTVYMAENSKKFFMRKCIEFLTGEHIRGMEHGKIKMWRSFVEDHFFLIDPNGFYSFEEILRMHEHQMSKAKIDGLLIDPYNGLKKNFSRESARINMHEYDYEVMNIFRGYSKKNDCCIYLNCHAVTSALRKIDKDGYLIAPNRADTEGGLKFASKADDFITVHRLTNHPTDWMNTDIHIRKIKEQETGGMPTPKDSPLKLQMMVGGLGFVDEYGWNPILEKQFDPINISQGRANTEMPNEFSMGVHPDRYIESQREEEIEPFNLDKLPF